MDVTPVELHHTLQTWLGMVQNGGQPALRPPRDIPLSLREAPPIQFSLAPPSSKRGTVKKTFEDVLDGQINPEYAHIAARSIAEGRLPEFGAPIQDDIMTLFHGNIAACRDPFFTRDVLRSFILSRTRLDLEQAAAAVVSAIMNDDAVPDKLSVITDLVAELRLVVTSARMWLTDLDRPSTESKFDHLVAFIRRIMEPYNVDVGELTNWRQILLLLMRIRRCKPDDRCLSLPAWMFESVNLEMPTPFQVWNDTGRKAKGSYPTSPAPADAILVTRTHFRLLQRHVLGYFRFWVDDKRLRHDIHALEDAVLFCTDLIQKRVANSPNTFVVAHYFFAYQRRLQRKVVSDVGWTDFLKKGETMKLMQNNPDILTTFEIQLSKLSGEVGVLIEQDIPSLIDRCCLLMEDYVRIFGRGDRNNLTFQPGQQGGSGRGPVDDYNLLVDVLHKLRKSAKEKGLQAPGHVQKFLAKDIMHWNNSWGDDAFANGKVPGWETWLVEKRATGHLKPVFGLKV